MRTLRNILLTFCLLSYALSICSQVNVSFADNIRTLQVLMNGKWGEPPVMLLGSGQYVDISFDDLQHNYVRYTYRITHCNADWEPSRLYTGDRKSVV